MTAATSRDAVFTLVRDAHAFSRRPGLAGRLESVRTVLPLVPDQLLHPAVPAEYVVRLGKLRVSQFLDDGREVTRAVLQAGALFATAPAGEAEADPAADAYPLADIVLVALGEAELWALPAGTLADSLD